MSDTPRNATDGDAGTLGGHAPAGMINRIVEIFLNSNLPIILIVLAVAVGAAALLVTPREEDPQIVVPMADVIVLYPGHSAAEVEQHVTTPLEKILYQIDGVEYVYSMSDEDQAVITVRFHVGQDRERSLVKLYKKIDENLDAVPPGVAGWIVKPVEIDDVPIVTLTLAGAADAPGAGPDAYTLRRVAEELVERLAAVEDISRAYVVGGLPRTMHVYLDPERLRGYAMSPLEVRQALQATNIQGSAGEYADADTAVAVRAGRLFRTPQELRELVVGVFNDQPVFLRDVADVRDGPAETDSYVRHGWGPASGFGERDGEPGTLVGGAEAAVEDGAPPPARPAVTIALAKKKGTNAVTVSREILAEAQRLRAEVVPDDVEMVVTRNAGLTSNDKVNELIEALVVALILATVILVVGMGWREALIVAVAVPVVFGVTLAVNLLFGYTINRVTLFALILALGLLVDDPIVGVENIVRHFTMRRKVSRRIVLEAVSEIRPPLITATLAVMASFVPLFFITGMMGPYMRPMALNVPVTMIVSMLVAFTITPWLTYQLLKRHYRRRAAKALAAGEGPADEEHDVQAVRRTALYRAFRPLMSPLLRHRWAAWTFLGVVGLLTVLTAGMAATRKVPLKMLPYGSKNDFQLVIDLPEGTTLERTDAAVRELEARLQRVPEVTDVTSYVGLAAPMDFNGMVRHYYLRREPNVADIQVNLVDRRHRRGQTHGLTLRERDDLVAIARRHGAVLKIVEAPPGPPVIATITAEVYGRPDQAYEDLLAGAQVVAARLAAEPGVVDVDDVVEDAQAQRVFVPDAEKAALNGVSTAEIVQTLRIALGGEAVGTVEAPQDRQPLQIVLRLPRADRSGTSALEGLHVKSRTGQLVPLAELGAWRDERVDQMIYHKNLRRVAYVFAEVAGRAPADAVVDVQADQAAPSAAPADATRLPGGWLAAAAPAPVEGRTFLSPGGGVPWAVANGIVVDFAGEGEWKLTIDVFRDMGLAFVAALVAIYVLLVGQTGSFVIPLVTMMAIPLTVLGIMPGFWLLNRLGGGEIGGYANPTFFTATGMIGMIALGGIVTRNSIILVDFIHLSVSRGRSLYDAILESCAVRLRPILMTGGTTLLSALPIAADPIFSGLAWSLIFGLAASTLFTLFVVPVIYWLLYANKPGHGVRRQAVEEDEVPVERVPESPARAHAT